MKLRAVLGSVGKALACGYTAAPEVPGSIPGTEENFRNFFSTTRTENESGLP